MHRLNVLNSLRLYDGDDFRAALSAQSLFFISRSNAISLIVALLVSLGLWGGIGFAVASLVSWVVG
jgi:hypothetical protein